MSQEQIGLSKATFGGGCFWCTEALFQRVDGVSHVAPGYAAGDDSQPTYEKVCAGQTGHAEVIQVTFDPDVVSYEALVRIHMSTHNPRTLNQQGNDVGTQYRSIIVAHDETQAFTARKIRAELDATSPSDSPIVTEVVDDCPFYPAEQYHHNYFNDNQNQGYCQLVIQPKIDKFLDK